MVQVKTKISWQHLVPAKHMPEHEISVRDPEGVKLVASHGDTPEDALAKPLMQSFSTIIDLADVLQNKTPPTEWYGKFIVFLGTKLIRADHGTEPKVLYLACDNHGRTTTGLLRLDQPFSNLGDSTQVSLALVLQ